VKCLSYAHTALFYSATCVFQIREQGVRIFFLQDIVHNLLYSRYAENADIEVADRFLAAAEKTLALLATQPESGAIFFVCKPELQGMRRFPVSDGFEKILLFYFPLKNGVDLVRELRRMGLHRPPYASAPTWSFSRQKLQR